MSKKIIHLTKKIKKNPALSSGISFVYACILLSENTASNSKTSHYDRNHRHQFDKDVQ
jgi:hypothetical protein